jgi:hypothetical protein
MNKPVAGFSKLSKKKINWIAKEYFSLLQKPLLKKLLEYR